MDKRKEKSLCLSEKDILSQVATYLYIFHIYTGKHFIHIVNFGQIVKHPFYLCYLITWYFSGDIILSTPDTVTCRIMILYVTHLWN